MFFRYQRGSRSLAANLSLSQSSAGAAAVTAEVQAEEQEEYDIPEEVETVIGELQPLLTLVYQEVLIHYLSLSTSVLLFNLQSISWLD